MKEYTLTKYACYMTNVSMAAVCNLSPLLFITFREVYGFSYTLLGLLVVVNFATQLLIDLVFSLFAKHFNIHKAVRITPLICFLGLLMYGLMPHIFQNAVYLWIVLGTVVFSVSAGLCEVLISPVIAAIPSPNPEREMSKLHSIYAWGVVGVVIISTLFLTVVGRHNWMYLAVLWSLVPLCAGILFANSKMPHMETDYSHSESGKEGISMGLMLCVICIFLGGASECTMSQWVSGFAEKAVHIPKLWGDIIGMALFGALLGMGRSLYAKYGKNVINVMQFGMIGAALCYLLASLSLNPVLSLVSCALTGICTSMLWPGTLIYAGEKYREAGVAMYALLAAGGDLGASVAPQLVGIVTDRITVSDFALTLSDTLGISAEQIGMRLGMLTASFFPIMGIVIIMVMKKYFKKQNRNAD